MNPRIEEIKSLIKIKNKELDALEYELKGLYNMLKINIDWSDYAPNAQVLKDKLKDAGIICEIEYPRQLVTWAVGTTFFYWDKDISFDAPDFIRKLLN